MRLHTCECVTQQVLEIFVLADRFDWIDESGKRGERTGEHRMLVIDYAKIMMWVGSLTGVSRIELLLA